MSITFQFIPEICKKRNLHNEELPLIAPNKWRDISLSVRENHKKCYYCKRAFMPSELDAHEVWEFDKKSHVQKLVRIVSACKMCHQTVHLDNVFSDKKFIYENYFIAINKVHYKAYREEFDNAKRLLDEENEIIDWKLDITHIVQEGFVDLADINFDALEIMAPGSDMFFNGIQSQPLNAHISSLKAELQKSGAKTGADVTALNTFLKKKIELEELVRQGHETNTRKEAEKLPDEVLSKETHETEKEDSLKTVADTGAVSLEEAPAEALVQEKTILSKAAINEETKKYKLFFNVIPEKCLYDHANICYKNVKCNCQICDSPTDRLYVYLDFIIENNGEMILKGQKLICPLCRETIFRGAKGLFKKNNTTTKHYMRVNNCDYETFKMRCKEAKERYYFNQSLNPFIYLKMARYIPPQEAEFYRKNGAFYDCRLVRWCLRPIRNLQLFRKFL